MTNRILNRCVESINSMLDLNPSLIKKNVFYDIDKFTWSKSLGVNRPFLSLFMFQSPVNQSYLEIDGENSRSIPIGAMYSLTSAALHVGFLLEFPRLYTKISPFLIKSATDPKFKAEDSYHNIELSVDNDHLQIYSDTEHSAQIIVRKSSDIISLVP